MQILSGTVEQLGKTMSAQLFNYRYKVFIQELGWELPSTACQERDQFDRDDTLHILAVDHEEAIVGCCRLLPTTRPYLLSEVFPGLLNGVPPPSSIDVWELSRFAAFDLRGRLQREGSKFSSDAALSMLSEAIKCAFDRRAKRIISVSPIGVERLLRRAGICAHRAGPPMVLQGYPLLACWIDVPSDICAQDIANKSDRILKRSPLEIGQAWAKEMDHALRYS